MGRQTFFCNLTTLVHFFSRSPSYFFAFSVSNVTSARSGSSSRKVAAVLARFLEERYARMDLCLYSQKGASSAMRSRDRKSNSTNHLQLLSLPGGQQRSADLSLSHPGNFIQCRTAARLCMFSIPCRHWHNAPRPSRVGVR